MAGFTPDPNADRELVNIHDYERAAIQKLGPGPLAYYTGGAMDERTLAANREAFQRRMIVPRIMTDVSKLDPSVMVLGRRWPHPLWVTPTALQRLAHPDGELASARAALARGLTFGLSTSASTDMADVAALGGPRWYQVYLLEDPGARRAMIERAIDCGYEALVLTADLQRLGRRERDIRVGFTIPSGVTLPNIAKAAGVPPEEAAQVPFVSTLDWRSLEWIASFGKPVVLKGVLHPEDARRALDHGASAVVVSNHGGRQLDGAIASLDALPGIVEAVGGRAPVLFDGGIRRGTEALLALALGATAVGIGRPVLWGLATAGEQGVGRVLDLLIAELELSMALAGCPDLSAVAKLVVRNHYGQNM
ncbi:MAG: alpha-hydroxy-acid oxidizing protein [Deltaproteobacteria bacterium]|nr:alpha-hydroxy-acid oxidizing protein [Deltaproteobacteria bacterium]